LTFHLIVYQIYPRGRLIQFSPFYNESFFDDDGSFACMQQKRRFGSKQTCSIEEEDRQPQSYLNQQ
jgi:hypothetical protein